MAAVGAAQASWRRTPVAERLKVIARLRGLIAIDPETLAASCRRPRLAESLAAEVLPLADACRFLEQQAGKILKPRRLGRKGRPFWLGGVESVIHREPLGVVLIVGPSNYPLMLPGIQALQALAAGNAVLVKPAPGCSEPMRRLRCLSAEAGLPEGLLQVLSEEKSAVKAAVLSGVDKVVLTGSAETGRAVQHLLADHLVPATMELSGCDLAVVTGSADLERAARCLALGLTFNGSRTCIAPRRVFVQESVAGELWKRLSKELSQIEPEFHVPENRASVMAAELVEEALRDGAVLLLDGRRQGRRQYIAGPTLLTSTHSGMRLLQSDVFVPVLSLQSYRQLPDVIRENDRCPYALGATVFSRDESEINFLTAEIEAGCVVVNDMLVPTSDPRIPFGGRKQSGFGVTRGGAGLEEMTQLKTVLRQRSSWLPHLDRPGPEDATLLRHLIQFTHASSLRDKIKAAWGLLTGSLAKRRNLRGTGSDSSTGPSFLRKID